MSQRLPIACRVTSDQVHNSSTVTDADDLTFPVLDGNLYHFKFALIVRSDTANVGVRLGLTTPTFDVLAANVGTLISQSGAGAVFSGAINASGDEVVATAVPDADKDYMAIIEGNIIPTADGDLQVKFGTETGTGDVTIRKGSWGVLWNLGPI